MGLKAKWNIEGRLTHCWLLCFIWICCQFEESRISPSHTLQSIHSPSLSQLFFFETSRQTLKSFLSVTLLWHSCYPFGSPWQYSQTISSAKTFCASLHSRSLLPAGRQPQNQLSNNSSGDAAHRLDSWPANQRDSYFKPHITAPGPPLSSPMPSHVTEGECGVN